VILVGLVAAQVKAVSAMARIRTIKPQFWTDEKIAKLPIGARLLFIGTWNLADDEGIVYWNAAYLRGQIFPYDVRVTNTVVHNWMANIASLNLMALYVDALQETYGFIRGWHKHQKINRPYPTQHNDILDMVHASNSVNNHGTITEHSVQGIENKEKEKDMCSEKASELATLLKGLILTNNPKALLKENVLPTWGKTFDLMLSKDKRDPQDIEAVLRFSQNDDFEKANVLSADKVRSRFDNLYMKMNSNTNGHNKQQSPVSMYKYANEEADDDNN